jgi:uncharacterized protein YjeT (DUF2065 family)
MLLRRDLYKDAIPAFLFGAFTGPFSELFYRSDYWRPPSILRIHGVAIEDIMFGIAILGLSLVLYPFAFRKQLSAAAAKNDRHLRSFGTIVIAFISLVVLVKLAHVNSVYTTAITFFVLWLCIGIFRHDLLLPGLISGGMLSLIALFVYLVLLNVFVSGHQLQHIWLLYGTRSGITIFGNVPVSELIWFFGIGCFFSIFELFVNKRTYSIYSIDSELRPEE